LTIVSERLELSRVTLVSSRRQRLFVTAVGIFLAGIALTVFDLNTGVRLAGIGELALAGWLLSYDLTRQTIRREGLTRFIAFCLLIGMAGLA
jgi:hypothetical protein